MQKRHKMTEMSDPLSKLATKVPFVQVIVASVDFIRFTSNVASKENEANKNCNQTNQNVLDAGLACRERKAHKVRPLLPKEEPLHFRE